MHLFRSVSTLVFLIVGFTAVAYGQDQKTFPTDDEINLLLTQTERALQQYKPVIDQEQIEMGKGFAEAVAKDRQVANGLEVVLKALKAYPQGFNSPEGFYVILWLDDASRNALACAASALNDSSINTIAGDTKKALSLSNFSRTCMDASTLLYTVSENASSLYERYIKGEEKMAAQAVEAAQECTDVLKKNSITPKQ